MEKVSHTKEVSDEFGAIYLPIKTSTQTSPVAGCSRLTQIYTQNREVQEFFQ
jgi:hypothetical protein